MGFLVFGVDVFGGYVYWVGDFCDFDGLCVFSGFCWFDDFWCGSWWLCYIVVVFWND